MDAGTRIPCQWIIVGCGRLFVSRTASVSPRFASIVGPGTTPLSAKPVMLCPGANSHSTSRASIATSTRPPMRPPSSAVCARASYGYGQRVFFRQILHEDLGCASYLIAGGSEAVVVDPKWEIEDYLRVAAAHELRIAHVLETHDHADHLSGRGRLMATTAAEHRRLRDAEA